MAVSSLRMESWCMLDDESGNLLVEINTAGRRWPVRIANCVDWAMCCCGQIPVRIVSTMYPKPQRAVWQSRKQKLMDPELVSSSKRVKGRKMVSMEGRRRRKRVERARFFGAISQIKSTPRNQPDQVKGGRQSDRERSSADIIIHRPPITHQSSAATVATRTATPTDAPAVERIVSRPS